MPLLTILLVTMNRRDLLEMALWYIYETSTAEERDLWIWDNASEDDTAAFLGTMVGWPGVRVFRSKANLGLAGPRKKMLSHVRTPYIFTLDDDVWMINREWVSGVSRVLGNDPSICQVAVPPTYGHESNDYGIAHAMLREPFFRVPHVRPTGRQPAPKESHLTTVPGSIVVSIAEESVLVPERGTQLPFSCSGNASAWRTSDILPLIHREERHPVVDLREAWGFSLQRERGMREATILNYGMWHPCPGPLWHLGHGERHWETRCRMASAIYGRSEEEQRSWLDAARRASGWGRVLDDPDEVLG